MDGILQIIWWEIEKWYLKGKCSDMDIHFTKHLNLVHAFQCEVAS